VTNKDISIPKSAAQYFFFFFRSHSVIFFFISLPEGETDGDFSSAARNPV